MSSASTIFARDVLKFKLNRFLICNKSYDINNQSFIKGQIDIQELGQRFPTSGLWRRPSLNELNNYI